MKRSLHGDRDQPDIAATLLKLLCPIGGFVVALMIWHGLFPLLGDGRHLSTFEL